MAEYVLTGAPGTGKTSLLAALEGLQYRCSAEVSRRLIIEESQKGSTCLPWIDLPSFADKALERMIACHRSMSGHTDEAVFFDRGIPDIIAYLEVKGLPVPSKYYAAASQYRYHPVVWLLPFWKDIYVQDPERWQTAEEAEEIDRRIRIAYRMAGYRLIELPRASIAERVRFIEKSITDLKECSL